MGSCCVSPPPPTIGVEERELAKTQSVQIPSDEDSKTNSKYSNSSSATANIQKHTNNNNNNNNNISLKQKEKKEKERIRLEKLKKEEEKRKKLEEERRRKEEAERKRKEEEERKRKEEEERKRKEEEERLERIRREEEEKRIKIELEKKRKKAIKRTSAIKELLKTETTYVNLLEECINIFVDPLANKPELLQKIQNSQSKLFSDIKLIYGVNKAFLNDLNNKFKNWDNNTTTIGDDFVKFAPFFRTYQNYFNNYENSSNLISKITKIEKNKYSLFNKWYNFQKSNYSQNRSMDFYLILPIQRLPRYKLCLNEIIKTTEADHPDLNDLTSAFNTINEITMECNEGMKKFESRQIVRDIEQKFVTTYSAVPTALVTPSRIFIKKGTLWRLTRKGEEVELIFYLFNDLLCYASLLTDIKINPFNTNINASKRRRSSSAEHTQKLDKSKLLRLQMRMEINDIFHVKDIGDPIPMKRYNGRAFEIHSDKKSIIVFAKDIKEKTEWLLALTNCCKKIQNSTKYTGQTRHELSAAVWVPDDWSDKCQVSDCKKKFNSITTRRHHCRWCGKLICSTCGKYKLAHKVHNNGMVKPVCKDCYNLHGGRFRASTTAVLYKSDCDDDDDEKDDINDKNNDNIKPKKTDQFLTVNQ